MYIYVRIYIHIYKYIRVLVCTYVYIYTYVYMYIHFYTHEYIHTSKSKSPRGAHTGSTPSKNLCAITHSRLINICVIYICEKINKIPPDGAHTGSMPSTNRSSPAGL